MRSGKSDNIERPTPAERVLADQVLEQVRVTRGLFPRSTSERRQTADAASLQVLLALWVSPGSPGAKLAQRTGIPRATVYSSLTALRKVRLIEAIDGAPGPRPLYRPTAAGDHRARGLLAGLDPEAKRYLARAAPRRPDPLG